MLNIHRFTGLQLDACNAMHVGMNNMLNKYYPGATCFAVCTCHMNSM